MVSWNPAILNRCAAPKISEFTSMDLADITSEFPQSIYWLQNHFLNSTPLRRPFKSPFKQMAINYIQKAQNIFHEYDIVRDLSKKYHEGNFPDNPKLSSYYLLIYHCSNIFIQYCSAVEICNSINKILGGDSKVFDKNDDSFEQRAYEIGNCVKHVTSCIDSGVCQNEHTLSIWLTNAGVESFDTKISYRELEICIRDVGFFAEPLICISSDLI